MTVDISLIPQERVQDLISTLDNIQNSLSNNLVHKSGSETISGLKTFSSDIKRDGTLSAGETYLIRLTDSNGKGTISQVGYYTSERLHNRLLNSNATSGVSGYLEIINKDDGVFYGNIAGSSGVNQSLSTASNLTTDTNIPTKGWVSNPSTSTNVVHRSGDETITGNKTFTGTTKILTPTLTKQNTEYEGGQIYFERSDSDVTMGDNNNPYIDFWQGKFRFIGQSSSQTGSSVNIPFSVDIQNNCLCHGNSMKVMNYVVETYMSGTSWYRVWSDGWIEQGGQFVGSTNINASTTTVTFIKPFTSYVAIAGGFTKSSNSAPYGQNLWQNGNTTLTTMVCSLPAYSSNGNVNHASSAGTGYWYACGY
jgi:hypothetical protein